VTNISKFILSLAVALTVFYGFGEYLGYLGVIEYTRREVVTPLYIKGIKDMSVIIVILVIMFFKKFEFNQLNLFILGFYTYIFMFSLLTQNILLSLSGIRSFLPILLAVFLSKVITLDFIRDIIRILFYVYVISLIAAIVQFFYGMPIYGTFREKYFFRLTSFFVNPSSFGIFIVVSIYLYLIFLYKKRITLLSIILLIISWFFVILTGSGISIIIMVLTTTLILLSRLRSMFLKQIISTISIFVLIYAIYNLDKISMRENIYLSGFGRLEILKNFFTYSTTEEILFGKGFGIGTNTLFNISPEIAKVYGQIPDSLYLSVLYQTGILGIIVFVLVNIIATLRLWKINKEIALGLIIICISGLTSNILELWPVNLIYSTLLSLGLIEKNKNNKLLYGGNS